MKFCRNDFFPKNIFSTEVTLYQNTFQIKKLYPNNFLEKNVDLRGQGPQKSEIVWDFDGLMHETGH